jgi:hypothetical protein
MIRGDRVWDSLREIDRLSGEMKPGIGNEDKRTVASLVSVDMRNAAGGR